MSVQNEKSKQSSSNKKYQVSKSDLPIHCPMPGMTLWDSHPKVFIPIEEKGSASCPYCGAEYILID